jgi:hypothetical protein
MHRVLGFTPVLISLFWVMFIIHAGSAYCRPPHADEDAAAHLFQLLMAAQIPLIVGYIYTKGARSFARVLAMLALQIIAWAAAAMAATLLT